MKQQRRGFTIVELLIVIVVIAILAAITIVAFNGVQERAKYAAMEQDFAGLHKALELYKVDHGEYPNSDNCVGVGSYENEWCGWHQSSNDSFIPGLAPQYIQRVSNLPKQDDPYDTYLYKSAANTDGTARGTTYYQLIRFRRAGLSKIEIDEAPTLGPAYIVNGNMTAWGIKSHENLNWW